MKKFINLIIFLVFTISIYGMDTEVLHGYAYEYNSVLKKLDRTEYDIKYSGEEETFFLVTSDIFTKNWVYLSQNDIELLRKTIEKYFEWEKIAIDNRVKIEKIIPNSKIKTGIIWKTGDNWYKSYNILLDFTFFSQTQTLHQLVISSDKVKSLENQYIENKISTLYFYKEDVIILYNALKADNIDMIIKEYNKTKNIEELFK